ncbi:MAG: hypothetical protein Q8R61_06540 [Thiobacillus sp.]|uniref:hypothetical protein n=1 Tax=Thiobacillus sp. TaxID=924 RepID=UPI0027336A6C|nr:hypothetical protein [Thiobacillus sp.]MDP3584762.1 hypothetical protein [Thiobacillus sp.]
MHWMASLLLAACAALPVNDEVPIAFRGYWVPQAQSCDAQLGLVVERDRLVLKNGTETRTFQDIDVCHACVGGSKSDGIEIWLIPEFGTARPSPFIVRLNADKVLDVTRISVKDDSLKQRFPLHGLPLRRCAK